MALVAISYPIEGLALLGWLAQVLEKVLSESLVELPLQLIGILVLGLSLAFLCNSLQNFFPLGYFEMSPLLYGCWSCYIQVFDWQGTASRKAVPPNPHPVFLVCKVCWIELLPCFPLLPSCLGEPMIAPLSRRVGTSIRNGFLHLVVPRDRDVFSVTYNRDSLCIFA